MIGAGARARAAASVFMWSETGGSTQTCREDTNIAQLTTASVILAEGPVASVTAADGNWGSRE